MSVQIFLQGKLLGIDEFLFAPAREGPRPGLHRTLALDQPAERSAAARAAGRAGPGENSARIERRRPVSGGPAGGIAPGAEAFLEAAAAEIAALSDGSLKLLWSVTENLGDWSDVRRRLTEQMEPSPRHAGIRSRARGAGGSVSQEYFAGQLGMKLRDAESAGWSPETPGRIHIGTGKHLWSLAGSSPGSAAVRPSRRTQRRRP